LCMPGRIRTGKGSGNGSFPSRRAGLPFPKRKSVENRGFSKASAARGSSGVREQKLVRFLLGAKRLLASPHFSSSICIRISSFRSPHVPKRLSAYLDRNR
jgi:hypothetical protein